MKVIRCKDCALEGRIECPLSYIEKQTLCFIEHPPMFYCGKGRVKEDYQPTVGDNIRNMTDRQLAHFISEIEKEAYIHGKKDCTFTLGRKQEDFWTGFLGHIDGEDY